MAHIMAHIMAPFIAETPHPELLEIEERMLRAFQTFDSPTNGLQPSNDADDDIVYISSKKRDVQANATAAALPQNNATNPGTAPPGSVAHMLDESNARRNDMSPQTVLNHEAAKYGFLFNRLRELQAENVEEAELRAIYAAANFGLLDGTPPSQAQCVETEKAYRQIRLLIDRYEAKGVPNAEKNSICEFACWKYAKAEERAGVLESAEEWMKPIQRWRQSKLSSGPKVVNRSGGITGKASGSAMSRGVIEQPSPGGLANGATEQATGSGSASGSNGGPTGGLSGNVMASDATDERKDSLMTNGFGAAASGAPVRKINILPPGMTKEKAMSIQKYYNMAIRSGRPATDPQVMAWKEILDGIKLRLEQAKAQGLDGRMG